MDTTIAVILGGGRGSRLYPLTKGRSKPAVPIGGKYRLVDIPISNCLNSEIRKIFVLTQFNSTSLNRHIKNTYNFDLFSHGFIDILAAEQTFSSQNWFQGTADAVRKSLHHLEEHKYREALVLSGDQLYQMRFHTMIKEHREHGADLTIATIPVNRHEATGFGIMKTNKENQIVAFVEKPGYDEVDSWKSEVDEGHKAAGKEYLASMGIYVFSRQRLIELFDDNPDATDFGKEIIPAAIKNDFKVCSYQFSGYWTDIGTVKSFFEANLALTDPLPAFNLYDSDQPVYTHARLLPASKVSGTTLERTVISEGCVIEASRIEHSLVGIRARIGRGTTIVDSIVMGNDLFPPFDELDSAEGQPPLGIGERCYIRNAIIDKDCRIGCDVRVNGGTHMENKDYENYSVVDGIVVIPKGSVIPDGTVI